MRRLVLMIFFVLFCGVMFTSCSSQPEFKEDEVITLSNGRTIYLENYQWLAKLIDLSKDDETGNYRGCIWLENYKGQDIFVTNMMLGSGGVMYYFFDRSGACIIIKGYREDHHPVIEAFAGKNYPFIEADEEEFINFFTNDMKLDVVVYSSFSLPCK